MCSAREIFTLLSETYTINPKEYIAYDVCLNTKDVFKTLVATILSQNSTDRAAYIAYNNLEKNVGVTPLNIIRVEDDKLKEYIKNVGLSNSKAKYIKNVAKFFLTHNQEELRELSCDELRELFLSIEGVGEKTADVVLVNCFKCKVFPIDTHIKRVVTRLGIVSEKPNYNQIANFFISSLNSEELLLAHQLLIAHGRRVCTARKPLCNRCILNYCCEYFNRMGKNIGTNSS